MDNLFFYTLLILIAYYFLFYLPTQKKPSSVPPPPQNPSSSTPKSTVNCPGPETVQFPSDQSLSSKDTKDLENTLDQMIKTIKEFSKELEE